MTAPTVTLSVLVPPAGWQANPARWREAAAWALANALRGRKPYPIGDARVTASLRFHDVQPRRIDVYRPAVDAALTGLPGLLPFGADEITVTVGDVIPRTQRPRIDLTIRPREDTAA